jgi:hypothetical protein
MTVIQGTTISSFDVQVLGVVDDAGAGGNRILVSASGPAVAGTGIAEGFSGSPVYCPASDGTSEVIGAISQGVGQYGNNVALVTPIQAMLDEPVDPPSDVPQVNFTTRALTGPLTVGGLSPSLLSVLQGAARRAGKSVVAAPSGGPPAFAVQQLVPGASVAANYSEGAIEMGAIGTVTYTTGDEVYAFGHELDGAGRRSLLLQDAYVYDVIGDPNVSAGDTSYKLAVGGHTLGTLTADTPNAVIGVLGAPPTLVPIDVTAHDQNTGQTIAEDTQVADETGIGQPLGSSGTTLVAPLAVGQAAIDVFDGPPADESGRMCLTITVRQLHAPLRFCKRYVDVGATGTNEATPPALSLDTGGDAATALSLIDQAQFAALDVTGVKVEIDAERGLDKAMIIGARARSKVTAGSRVQVHLTVRVYQGRLVHITFPLRIPRAAKPGPLNMTIEQNPAAAQSQSGSALANAIASALGGGPGSSNPASGNALVPGPGSAAELALDFGQLAPYDGLVARVGRQPGPDVYRNRNLLITGAAPLSFDVAN